MKINSQLIDNEGNKYCFQNRGPGDLYINDNLNIISPIFCSNKGFTKPNRGGRKKHKLTRRAKNNKTKKFKKTRRNKK
jgi:hypothetical protein